MSDDKIPDIFPEAPPEVKEKLEGLAGLKDSIVEPEAVAETPPATRVKAVLSPKRGSWKKHEKDGLISWVRAGGLAVVEGNKEDGFLAILPSTEVGGAKLGPFNRSGRAKDAAEEYLHTNGYVYYHEDVQNMNAQFRKMMKNNKLGANKL